MCCTIFFSFCALTKMIVSRVSVKNVFSAAVLFLVLSQANAFVVKQSRISHRFDFLLAKYSVGHSPERPLPRRQSRYAVLVVLD